VQKIFQIRVLIVLSFFPLVGFSQSRYITDPNYIRSASANHGSLRQMFALYPDTSINDLHQVVPMNFLGNLGLPSLNYVWQTPINLLGFRLYNNPYSNFSEQTVRYFQTKGPYAQLTGIAGTKVYQYFEMRFTTTFKNNFNIAVAFKRFTSNGFYRRQQSFTNNFYSSFNYENKKRRFGFYGSAIANTNNHQENGGLLSDTLKENDVTVNKEILQVKLATATRRNSDQCFSFQPYWRLNRYDSLRTTNHFLQLGTSVRNETLKYTDAGSGNNNFYYLSYYDTLKTLDSTNLKQLKSSLSYNVKSANFQLSAGYKNELNRVHQYFDSLYINHLVYSDLDFSRTILANDSSKKQKAVFNSSLKASYGIEGYNQNDVQLVNESRLLFNQKQEQKLGLLLLAESRKPDLQQQFWNSNHFRWDNNYMPTRTLAGQLSYGLGRLVELEVRYANISNLIYYDNVALPRQVITPLNVFNTGVKFNRIFLKHIGVHLNYHYQTTDGNNYLYLPNHVAQARLFYQGFLSRNNLWLQIGAQVQTFSNFYSYNYMPVTQVFYLQDQRQTGQYLFTEFYLNARIRPVNFFIRVENALQGLLGKDYALVNGYYQPDRAFRFGVSWQFFD